MCDINIKNQEAPKEHRDFASIMQSLFLNTIGRDNDTLQLIKDKFLESNPNIAFDDIKCLDYEKQYYKKNLAYQI